jgi:hypothetical protein
LSGCDLIRVFPRGLFRFGQGTIPIPSTAPHPAYISVIFSFLVHNVSTKQGEDTFRSEYMKREGVPFFVWYMGFKPGLTTFLHKFRAPVDALKNSKNNQDAKKKSSKKE